MRARTVLISLACAVGLLVTGCSSGISGTAQLPVVDAGAVTTGAGGLTTGADPTTSPDPSTDSSDSDGADPGASDPGSGAGGDTGLPPATSSQPIPGMPTDLSGIPGMPTDLSGIPGMPTDLSGIPGLGGECGVVLTASVAIGLLLIGPALGGKPLTQDQVDQAFADLDNPPAEIAGAIKLMHQAANQAVGKSSAEAMQILGSDQVDKAMDQLSDFADKKCGGS